MAESSAESKIDEPQDAFIHTEITPYSLDPNPIDPNHIEESQETEETGSEESDDGDPQAPDYVASLNGARLDNTAW